MPGRATFTAWCPGWSMKKPAARPAGRSRPPQPPAPRHRSSLTVRVPATTTTPWPSSRPSPASPSSSSIPSITGANAPRRDQPAVPEPPATGRIFRCAVRGAPDPSLSRTTARTGETGIMTTEQTELGRSCDPARRMHPRRRPAAGAGIRRTPGLREPRLRRCRTGTRSAGSATARSLPPPGRRHHDPRARVDELTRTDGRASSSTWAPPAPGLRRHRPAGRDRLRWRRQRPDGGCPSRNMPATRGN